MPYSCWSAAARRLAASRTVDAIVCARDAARAAIPVVIEYMSPVWRSQNGRVSLVCDVWCRVSRACLANQNTVFSRARAIRERRLLAALLPRGDAKGDGDDAPPPQPPSAPPSTPPPPAEAAAAVRKAVELGHALTPGELALLRRAPAAANETISPVRRRIASCA